MTLEDRINKAEALAKEGKTVSGIMMETGLSRLTATCIRARVTGANDYSGLKKCLKEDQS